jgi:hypothetical protein
LQETDSRMINTYIRMQSAISPNTLNHSFKF